MISKSTLFACLCACTFLVSHKASATNYTFTTGTPVVNYTLFAGDSLSIASGTYTGQISSSSTTAKIRVAPGANFNPSSMDFLGSLWIYGKAKLPKINGYASGLKIMNYGIVEVTGNAFVTGGTLTNYYGAVINFDGGLTFMLNSATLINIGFINIKGDVYFGNAVLTNTGNFVGDGDIKLDLSSTITNTGKLYSKGLLLVQNSTYSNSCRTISENSIKILGSTVFTNDGLLWAAAVKNNGYLENQSTIVGQPNSVIKAVDMSNYGTIRGSGKLYFTGATRTQNRVGTSGVTADSIFVYDATRTVPDQIFDYQSGNVYNNVKFKVFSAPDTIGSYPHCSADIVAIPLATQWDHFDVEMITNLPRLSWSTQSEAGTLFEIERSYDNINFSVVRAIESSPSNNAYNFNDSAVNKSKAVVYYRIRNTNAAGQSIYSATRTLKFALPENVTVQVSPNPFHGNFQVTLQKTVSGPVTFSIYNLNGQLRFSTTQNIRDGVNTLIMPAASSLPEGMYMLRILAGNQLIATEKIIKQ